MNALARSPKQLGALIQRSRKAKGLTQSQLADLAGLRQELVSKIETGQSGSRIASIYALLSALDLEMTLTPRSRSSADDLADLF